MKKAVIATVILIFALSAAFRLKRSLGSAKPEPIDLKTQLQNVQEQVEAEQARAAALEREVTTARLAAARQEQKAAALASSQTNSAPSSPASMLKDPAMRAMMQKQQMQALDRRVKQLVNADMQKKLGLGDPETAQLRDLLKKKQQPAIELMMAMMSGELDENEAAARGADAKAQRAAIEGDIRNLLGPEKFNYLDWYERSDTERGRVREFRSQFADAGQPLSREQEEQLTLAMFDERQNFKFTIDYHDPSAFDYSRLDDYFSEANMERFFTEMEQLNEKTLTRVQSMLTPEQLQEFQRLQEEHLEKGKTTVRMTHALFPLRKRATP